MGNQWWACAGRGSWWRRALAAVDQAYAELQNQLSMVLRKRTDIGRMHF